MRTSLCLLLAVDRRQHFAHAHKHLPHEPRLRHREPHLLWRECVCVPVGFRLGFGRSESQEDGGQSSESGGAGAKPICEWYNVVEVLQRKTVVAVERIDVKRGCMTDDYARPRLISLVPMTITPETVRSEPYLVPCRGT